MLKIESDYLGCERTRSFVDVGIAPTATQGNATMSVNIMDANRLCPWDKLCYAGSKPSGDKSVMGWLALGAGPTC